MPPALVPAVLAVNPGISPVEAPRTGTYEDFAYLSVPKVRQTPIGDDGHLRADIGLSLAAEGPIAYPLVFKSYLAYSAASSRKGRRKTKHEFPQLAVVAVPKGGMQYAPDGGSLFFAS